MTDEKPKNKLILFIIILVVLSVFVSLSNYIRIPVAGSSDFIKFFAHFVILCISLTGFLLLISIHRIIFALFAPIVLLASLASAASLYFYNITITSEILEVSLKTDWSITKEFLSVRLILFSFLLLCVIVGIIYFRFQIKLKKSTSLSLLAFSILFIIPAVITNKKRNNTIISRVPYSIITAAKDYKAAVDMSKLNRAIIAEDATSIDNDSLLVVLVLGESLRNDHLGFNGYERNTTPKLSDRQVFGFKNNKSVHTYTASSIPQILTRANKENTSVAYEEETVLNIFERAGFNTLWFANQVPDYTYASIAKGCSTYLNLNAFANTYSDIVMTDQNILDTLPYYVSKTIVKPQILVLHTMGSHWYYNYRCPQEKRVFFPITSSRSFANNSAEEMINSYDNSVLFTDYFINEVISLIANKNTILVYVSDHGESLGENNKWLHAFEHETLHNAACFIWMSDKYKMNYPKALAVEQNILKNTSTSSIFHTLLDAGRISTSVLCEKKSLLSNEYISE